MGSMVSTMIMIPIHIIAMYVIFTKYFNMFAAKKIQMHARYKRRMRRVYPI